MFTKNFVRVELSENFTQKFNVTVHPLQDRERIELFGIAFNMNFTSLPSRDKKSANPLLAFWRLLANKQVCTTKMGGSTAEKHFRQITRKYPPLALLMHIVIE